MALLLLSKAVIVTEAAPIGMHATKVNVLSVKVAVDGNPVSSKLLIFSEL